MIAEVEYANVVRGFEQSDLDIPHCMHRWVPDEAVEEFDTDVRTLTGDMGFTFL